MPHLRLDDPPVFETSGAACSGGQGGLSRETTPPFAGGTTLASARGTRVPRRHGRARSGRGRTGPEFQAADKRPPKHYCTILYYTILYYAMLYYTILHYTILCYAMLCYTIIMQTETLRLREAGQRRGQSWAAPPQWPSWATIVLENHTSRTSTSRAIPRPPPAVSSPSHGRFSYRC